MYRLDKCDGIGSPGRIRNPRTPLICANCGKEFIEKKPTFNRARFCCLQCRKEYQRKRNGKYVKERQILDALRKENREQNMLLPPNEFFPGSIMPRRKKRRPDLWVQGD
jgi:hypothetical protein